MSLQQKTKRSKNRTQFASAWLPEYTKHLALRKRNPDQGPFPKYRLSAVECLLQLLAVQFDHLPHRVHDGFLLFLILAGVPLVEFGRRDLPANTVLVDQPAALHGLASTA